VKATRIDTEPTARPDDGRRCATGTVRHRYPDPWLIRQWLAASDTDGPAGSEPVCDGVVEVYGRSCRCRPWVADDPRLPGLYDELARLAARLPVASGPGPDPSPWSDLGFLRDGAIDERARYAARDLRALRALSGAAVAGYVNARPYLRCDRLGVPTRLGQATLRPGGKFKVCWRDWAGSGYRPQYAFVVRQTVNGRRMTTYDGVAAGQWYDDPEDVTLASYSWQARSCRHNQFPGTGAFALLRDIGGAESYRAVPPLDAGEGTAAGAHRHGGALPLRLHFSEAMRAAGAAYYRLSVAPPGAGERVTLADPVSWLYFARTGGETAVGWQALGPVAVGAETDLFTIPYGADRRWQGGQYHAALDTSRLPDGQHLLTLEVFDAAGRRLRPVGTAGAGPAADFTFRRWCGPAGETVEVPDETLTHPLRSDNRPAVRSSRRAGRPRRRAGPSVAMCGAGSPG